LNDFEFRLVSDLEEWDQFLRKSPQNTRFLAGDFLEILQREFRIYGLSRKGMYQAMVPVVDKSQIGTTFPPWCYYQGPVISGDLLRAAAHKKTAYEIQLAETLCTEVAKVENHFFWSLHPSLWDVRGYDWVHYHSLDKPKCTVTPKYTALVELDGATKEGIRRAARSARRQEEKYAVNREHLSITEDVTIGELFELYKKTYARQGLAVDVEQSEFFHPFCHFFISRNIGKIIGVVDEKKRLVAASFIFEDVDKTWHVPILATADTRYGGTLLYFNIIDQVRAQNGKAVDFNGANSPKRAYFKHSIGALPKLFFEVDYLNKDQV
jgi:hypothetical protein